jgi:hypothetical protein
MALDGFQDTLSKFAALDFNQELLLIVEENTPTLEQLQRDQMATGLDADGQPVNAAYGPYYRPYTIEQKKKFGVGLGAVTDRVTNYMTGSFYESLQKKVYSNGIVESNSNVSYFEDILTRSGEKALDLNEENRLLFAHEIVVPSISKIINDIFK